MRIYKTIVLLLFFFSTKEGWCQKEANIWYFGWGRNIVCDPIGPCAGLNFNNSTPSALTDGAMSTNEGCASIADKVTGALLFYTDGVTVYNVDHDIMPNGDNLKGNPTSTQSAVVVPVPENDTLYYIFAVDGEAGTIISGACPYADGGGGGVTYSLVNMKLDNGKGDIVQSSKNTLLLTPTSEKLTAVRHSNKKDVWVIIHKWQTDEFYAYLVTKNGISAPVISKTGVVHTSSFGGTPTATATLGYMKSSTDGKQLAVAIYDPINIVEIHNFNTTSGDISLEYTITQPFLGIYGVSFSPDNSKLYVTNIESSFLGLFINSYLCQYDLCAGNPSLVNASRITIDSSVSIFEGLNFGAVQNGPDGKTYVATPGKSSIAVINNPNAKGLACNYERSGINLTNKSTNGLPDFIEDYFFAKLKAGFTHQDTCTGLPVAFTDSINLQPDSWLWDFGDPASGDLNTSAAQHPTHTYMTPGTYQVKLIVFKDCDSSSVVHDINICSTDIDFPNIFTPNDDGVNDHFSVTNSASLKSAECLIYNRWGNEVYSWNAVSGSWDGITTSGTKAPAGVYFYTFKGEKMDGVKYSQKGTISLIR